MLLVLTAVLVPLVLLVVPARADPVPEHHPDAARLRAELAAVRSRAGDDAEAVPTRRRGRLVGASITGLVGASGSRE